jgi:hypothetical protein
MKKKSQELPWWFYLILAVFSFVTGLLALFGILDFSPKPGVQGGLKVVFTGLHEIFGPAGPAGALALFGGVFLWVALKGRKKQNALDSRQRP